MSFIEDMQSQLDAASQVMSTKSELMEYFQREGGRNWNSQLSSALQPFIPLTKSGKPQSITNIERRHQARGDKGIPGTTKATAEQYKALGEQIGPVPPKNGYSVTYHGEIRISNNCWPRSFGPMLVTGDDARELAATGDVFIIFRVYFQGLDMAEGWCGDPTITIEPASDGQTQMHFKHGAQGSKFAGIFK